MTGRFILDINCVPAIPANIPSNPLRNQACSVGTFVAGTFSNSGWKRFVRMGSSSYAVAANPSGLLNLFLQESNDDLWR